MGALLPIWTEQIIPDNSGIPLPLNGNIGIKLHFQQFNTSGNPVGGDILGTGGIVIDYTNQQFTYSPVASDPFVTTAGIWQYQFEVVFPIGSIFSDPAVIITKATD